VYCRGKANMARYLMHLYYQLAGEIQLVVNTLSSAQAKYVAHSKYQRQSVA